MVELKEITAHNFDEVIMLKVATNQENFVSSVVHSLAQAWVYKNTAFPYAIYADGLLVVFVMLGYYEARNQYTLWKFMIDEKYQHKGYGKKALLLAIKYLATNFKVKEIFTGCALQNDVAKKLYRCVGFEEAGEFDEFQLEMKLLIDSDLGK